MPFHPLFQDDGGVVCKGSGVVEGKDAYTMNAQLYSSDEAVKKIRYQIVDLTEITEFRITSDEIKGIASQDARAMKLNPNMYIAIVAPDPMSFGMNRMYQAYTAEGQDKVGVFRDLLQAKAWIAEHLNEPLN